MNNFIVPKVNIDNGIKTLLHENHVIMLNLRNQKNKIDNQKNWDIAKKCANEYEFIFSFNNDGVADIIPISRSYFKLIEIIYDNDLVTDITNNYLTNMKVACICEGPGGFIQALDEISNKYNISFNPIDCITLISNDKKVPNWKLHNLSNFKVSYGKDGTGDIYKIQNIDYFIKTVGQHNCYIVTADGGFDFSNDFNSQELNFTLLLLCEVYISLNIQIENGIFIVKVFDFFHINTINIICLLRMFYSKIIIHKPKTSRPANSEKYIVCKGFKKPANINKILNYIRVMISQKSCDISELINDNILHDTLYHIVNFNKKFVSLQIAYINKTLEIIKNNTFNKKLHIDLCLKWCNVYNIPIKKNYEIYNVENLKSHTIDKFIFNGLVN